MCSIARLFSVKETVRETSRSRKRANTKPWRKLRRGGYGSQSRGYSKKRRRHAFLYNFATDTPKAFASRQPPLPQKRSILRRLG